MARHANLYKKQEVFKLPGIHVTNRVTNPHYDAQSPGRPPEQRKGQSMPLARHNAFTTAAADPGHGHGHGGMTAYYSKTSPGRLAPTRRQQSLPSRTMQAEEKERLANSAPSRKARSLPRKAPLPQLNTLVAKSRGPGGSENGRVVTTNFAGYSTKDQEASPTRYTRFASTWAQVRAENHIDMCAPTSPDSPSRKTRSEEVDRSPSQRSAARSDPAGTGRTPDRLATKDHSPRFRLDLGSRSPSPQKDSSTRATGARKDTGPHTKTALQTKRKSREGKEKQNIRFEDEQPDHGQQSGDAPAEGGEASRPKSGRTRPQWNNRLALTVPVEPEAPAKSWRRYEAELTHAPTLTSTEDVYKAYTGASKQQLRDRQLREGNELDLMEERPSTRGSLQREGSGDLQGPGAQSPREYILTRNEAKMYLHLQNVYGSEAHRQQHKDWFFKKLTDVQEKELKQQAADRKRKQQRLEESKKRQKRQLMFVRRKFRKEQLHRFRTQYVTSRVLEYEKENREVYGLPEEWDEDDLNNYGDVGELTEDDSQTERKPTKDSAEGNTDSDMNQSSTGSEHSVQDNQVGSEQSEEDLYRVKGNDKSISGASKPTAIVGLTSDPSSADSDTGVRSTHGTNTSAALGKNSAQRNSGSQRQPGADKSGNVHASTKNSKQTSNSSQGSSSEASKSKQKGISSSNGPKNTAGNTGTDTDPAINKHSASDTSKTPKQQPEKAKPVKDTASMNSLNADTTPSSGTKGPQAVASGERNTAKKPAAAAESVSSSVVRDKSTPGAPATKNNASTALPASDAAATATGAKTAGSKPGSDRRGNNSGTTGAQGTEDSLLSTHDSGAQKNRGIMKKPSEPGENSSGTGGGGGKRREDSLLQKEDNKVQKNKEGGVRKDNNDTASDNKGNSVSKEKHSSLANKQRDSSTLNKGNTSDVSEGGKRHPNSHDNKQHDALTSRSSGPDKAAPNTAPFKDPKGQASHTSPKAAPSNPTLAAHPQSRDGPGKAAGPAHKDAHARKRKPGQQPPKSEAEQKRQMERKYGKIFDVNTGPTWNPGAKPPKMEGIDTVVVKVTDEKGRRRLKKREVKDVVKEAKDQLALPDNHRRSARRAGGPAHDSYNGIRPPSADTLDFDDDDEDDEEDVFERVRRKYNLQIDSDDDDSTI